MLSETQVDEVRSFAGEAMERLSWSQDQIHAEQTRRLRQLVAHAQQKSEFHSDRIGHLDAAGLEVGDLRSIPPMTKNDVMSNWDRLVTDPRVRLSDVTEHLQQLANGETRNAFYLNEYYNSAMKPTQTAVFNSTSIQPTATIPPANATGIPVKTASEMGRLRNSK